MFVNTATVEQSFQSSTQAAQGEQFPAQNLNGVKIPPYKNSLAGSGHKIMSRHEC